MEKAWLTPQELLGIAGLPKSRQGLNKRAREEGWEKRKRKGVQGRAVEYARESLPQEVRKRLQIREMTEISPPAYTALAKPLLASWIQIFEKLSINEQEALIDFVLREGAIAMLSRLEITGDPNASTT